MCRDSCLHLTIQFKKNQLAWRLCWTNTEFGLTMGLLWFLKTTELYKCFYDALKAQTLTQVEEASGHVLYNISQKTSCTIIKKRCKPNLIPALQIYSNSIQI